MALILILEVFLINLTALKCTSSIIDSIPPKDACDVISRVAFIAWYIWKARNEFIFRHVAVNPLDAMARASFAMSEFCTSVVTPQVHMDNHPVGNAPSSWKAPDCRSLKANCDIALKGNSSSRKIAVVIQDWKGIIVDGVAKSVSALSSLQGELFAIREACLMMTALGRSEVEVESDNKEAIHLSVSELVPPWQVSTLVQDIRQMVATSKAYSEMGSSNGELFSSFGCVFSFKGLLLFFLVI